MTYRDCASQPCTPLLTFFKNGYNPLLHPCCTPCCATTPPCCTPCCTPLSRDNPPCCTLCCPPLLHPMKHAQDNHFVTSLVYRNLRRPSRISALSLSSASCTFRASNPMSRLFIFTTWPMESLDNLGFKRAHPLQLLCRSLLKGLFLFSLGMLEYIYIYIYPYSYMPVQNKVSEHMSNGPTCSPSTLSPTMPRGSGPPQ